MDLAKRARDQGRTFNPCFVSAPGLGKSEILQQWCRQNGYGMYDLRAALVEAPDLTGYPVVTTLPNGRQKMFHATPDFLPEEGKGVFFLDEVNRGATSTMNCFMQLLTDRKIKDYTLPPGWIIASAVNPENDLNDVNAMDSALKDRLEFFNIGYSKKAHVDYMHNTEYDATIMMWVDSGTWRYVAPDEVGNVKGAKYISPRTLSKLNAAIKAGIPERLERDIYNNILGDLQGKSFYQFKNNEQPVTFDDLTTNKRKALKRLAEFCRPDNYKTGHVSITAKSLIDNEKDVTDELLYEVSMTIGAEQAMSLINEIEFKRKVNAGTLLVKLTTKYPDFRKYCQTLTNDKA